MSNKDANLLEKFETLPTAFWRIVLTSSVLILSVFLLSLASGWPSSQLGISWPFKGEKIRRFVFVCYVCVLGGVWITYFLSRLRVRFFRVKTLRNLLAKTSEHWREYLNAEDGKKFTEFIELHHRKAQSSMVTVAIMIAACLIVLGEIHCVFLNSRSVKNDIWAEAILAVATLAAMLSLICFIISADALDSIFNKFKTEQATRILKHHFYLKTINPKYSGFISLIVAVVFVVAYHSLPLSCIVLALSLTIGYPHWFPDVEQPSRPRRESIVLGLVLMIVIVLIEGWL